MEFIHCYNAYFHWCAAAHQWKALIKQAERSRSYLMRLPSAVQSQAELQHICISLLWRRFIVARFLCTVLKGPVAAGPLVMPSRLNKSSVSADLRDSIANPILKNRAFVESFSVAGCSGGAVCLMLSGGPRISIAG